jgi:hypothetical protein
LSFRVKGIEEAKKILDEFISRVPSISRETLNIVGTATLDLVAARTPVRTGHYLSNHRMEITSDFVLRLWNPVPYGPFLEWGTSRMMPRPHWRPAIEYLKRRFPILFAQRVSETLH